MQRVLMVELMKWSMAETVAVWIRLGWKQHGVSGWQSRIVILMFGWDSFGATIPTQWVMGENREFVWTREEVLFMTGFVLKRFSCYVEPHVHTQIWYRILTLIETWNDFVRPSDNLCSMRGRSKKKSENEKEEEKHSSNTKSASKGSHHSCSPVYSRGREGIAPIQTLCAWLDVWVWFVWSVNFGWS